MFLSPVFPPLFSLHRHIFHDERKCKESSLDVKAHDVLLQLNSSRSPSSSQILKKDFYLVSDRSVGYNSTCYTVRPEILFFFKTRSVFSTSGQHNYKRSISEEDAIPSKEVFRQCGLFCSDIKCLQ